MDGLHLAPNDERRIRRLGLVSQDLALGRTAIERLSGRMAGPAAPVTNLVRPSAIAHANVSAAADLGRIVPGP
jgi:hypothetical protein